MERAESYVILAGFLQTHSFGNNIYNIRGILDFSNFIFRNKTCQKCHPPLGCLRTTEMKPEGYHIKDPLHPVAYGGHDIQPKLCKLEEIFGIVKAIITYRAYPQ